MLSQYRRNKSRTNVLNAIYRKLLPMPTNCEECDSPIYLPDGVDRQPENRCVFAYETNPDGTVSVRYFCARCHGRRSINKQFKHGDRHRIPSTQIAFNCPGEYLIRMPREEKRRKNWMRRACRNAFLPDDEKDLGTMSKVRLPGTTFMRHMAYDHSTGERILDYPDRIVIFQCPNYVLDRVRAGEADAIQQFCLNSVYAQLNLERDWLILAGEKIPEVPPVDKFLRRATI